MKNSPERMIELYQQRIDGFEHEFSNTNNEWRRKKIDTFMMNTVYRIKQNTRIINGIEVPDCLRGQPKYGDLVWCIGINLNDSPITYNDNYLSVYKNGLLFKTEGGAEKTRDAIFSQTRISE